MAAPTTKTTNLNTANSTYDFVIIGGGIAGVTCCEQLIAVYNERQQHKTVALISAHPLLKSVSRLQKVSQHLMDIEVAEYSAQAFHARYGSSNNFVKLNIIQGFVIDIGHSHHSITYSYHTDDDGTGNDKDKQQRRRVARIRFGQCLIATGGSPRTFYVEQPQQSQKHRLIHTLRDSETVENFSKIVGSSDCQSMVVVGNGGISLELVYTLLRMRRPPQIGALKIVWIIKHSHIGNTFLDEASAAFLIPSLFPEKDPVLNSAQRTDELGAYDHIQSTQHVQEQHNQTSGGGGGGGAAVGPRWVGSLSKAAKPKPLWMEHSEIHNDSGNGEDEHKKDGPAAAAEEVFPNELILKVNCDVSQIEEHQTQPGQKMQLQVLLTNGERIVVDQLLCAMGVAPNTRFCDASVFDMTDSGELKVNEYLQTSVKDVYCAGDCCELHRKDAASDDTWFQMKLWSQSQEMGWIAAHAMAWQTMEEIENDIHLQFNWELFGHITRFFGQKCIFLGRYNTKADEKQHIKVLMRVKPQVEFVKMVVKRGRVIGAVLIGETDLEETCENLILNKTDITVYGDHFLDFDVDLEAMFD